MKSEKIIKIALVGQPNVGKSMLINSISNAKLKVGNFSGVTVAKEEVIFKYKDYRIEIVDLPGSYSLNDYTLEERVTKEFLENENYDIILNVLDSTNLERNLYLTSELLALDKKMILALNMSDEAKKENISINSDQLSKIIGKPCVKTSAANKIGINDLIHQIIKKYEEEKLPTKLIFSDVIEEEISNIIKIFKDSNYKTDSTYREIAIKLLKEDKKTYKFFHDEPIWTKLQPILNEAFEHISIHYNTKDMEDIFNDEKFSFSKGIVTEVVIEKKNKQKTITEKIDAILIHKFFGLPIFLFLMWGLFQLTFDIGNIPMDMIDAFFASLIDGTKELLGDNQISSIIADGAIAGVGAVVLFIPNIVILFFGIALLETTGYMSRVAFLLDGFFHKFGLHGKSFIPLVTGFGCSVPAYMSARTLKNERDRLLTLFIIGFMSCGARLPIYVLFTGAFFSEKNAGNILFLIYIGGAILGLIAAKILKIVVFKSEDEPFVMEMPKYRLPSSKLIWHTVSNQAMMYLKKAGTFILAASLLIWVASNYPKHPEVEASFNKKIELAQTDEEKDALANELSLYNLENSYLGYIGKFSEPLFAPLGFDWRMSVALETGLAAKEIVVSTLGILYGLGDENDENSKGLIEKIKTNISMPAGIAFIVFVMIYLPCLAATMVFTREAGGWKYLGYLFVFTTGTAWVLSFIAFNLVSMLVA
ncbi:ferrous iron transport protein B [Malaciobacter molluscorum LMG 25693]|uniref:Ferrous iron transport protein B n=1 Tax=Malaciobacter molluscorum LMG 25693 TaxID=870501 RepID=A0A2G1DEN1_9BACT|nr:ferrous iron transport protein B [Malaciobacter molluscorum]AXX93090.1 ferrous iron transport protein B [Malaciobacter molluscorum LMG 25693]PHO16943.1 ferrous iron transport protein B [Malaciobacter molluscorum LMG 25693]RXJ95560.1 ferrous iron transport protein B [Malaciobacter molluscorum]